MLLLLALLLSLLLLLLLLLLMLLFAVVVVVVAVVVVVVVEFLILYKYLLLATLTRYPPLSPRRRATSWHKFAPGLGGSITAAAVPFCRSSVFASISV